MNSRERVLMAIAHQEPDKVPKGEIGQGVDEDLACALLRQQADLTGTDEARFQNRRRVMEMLHMDVLSVGLDTVGSPRIIEIGTDPDGHTIHRDTWLGREYVTLGYGAEKNIRPALTDPMQVYDFQWPSTGVYATHTIERWKRETDYFLLPVVIGGFEASYELNNMDDFMIWCHTNKEEVKEWTRKQTEFGAAQAQMMVQAGADAIVIADDMAYNSGTFISPRLLRELIFPYLEEEVHQIKRLGVPVFLHSDGDVSAILDDVVAMGFDGWQAVQPSAGMEIARIKQRYGDRLCLMGNIDIDLLGRGTPAEIEAEVTRVLEVAAPGGGFILSSSNELGRETSPENARAMYGAAERWEGRSRMGKDARAGGPEL